MKSGFIFILLIAVLSLLIGTSVQAEGVAPPLPQVFYGNLTINGQPAPAGTQVSASGTGVVSDTAGNPITTVTVGYYGSSAPLAAKLMVQGYIQEGATITFYVNGEKANQTTEWHSGTTTQLALTVSNVIQPSPTPTPTPTPISIPVYGGGGTYGMTFEGVLNFFGQNYTYLLDETGALTRTITLTSPTANLVVIIPKGTILKDQDGNFLTPLGFTLCTNPSAPPEGMAFLGKPVNSTPDGATFSPYINVQLGFIPDNLPAGINEQDISAGYYDSAAEKWQKLTGTLDAVKNTVSFKVTHLCCFALFYPLAPPTGTTAAQSTVPTGGISEFNTGDTSTPTAAALTPEDTQSAVDNTPVKSTIFVYLTIALAIVLLSIGLVVLRRKRK